MKRASDPISATLSALADPTRRAILARLADGEASVGEIAAPFATLAAEFPDLSMGSYPFIHNGAHGTNLVIRGTDPARVSAAMVQLTEMFG